MQNDLSGIFIYIRNISAFNKLSDAELSLKTLSQQSEHFQIFVSHKRLMEKKYTYSWNFKYIRTKFVKKIFR